MRYFIAAALATVAVASPSYGYGYAPAYGGDCYSVRRVNRFGELVYRRVCY